MASELMIDIAGEFHPYPAGRDEDDGPHNGRKFREELLLPRVRQALEKKQDLVVSLRGVKSFGSSFFEEAFGGLVRAGIDKRSLLHHLRFQAPDFGGERYVSAILRYIEKA